MVTVGGQAGGWLHNCRPVSAFGVRVPGFAVCPNCPHLGQTRKDGEWTLGARASCRVQVVTFFGGVFSLCMAWGRGNPEGMLVVTVHRRVDFFGLIKSVICRSGVHFT